MALILELALTSVSAGRVLRHGRGRHLHDGIRPASPLPYLALHTC